MWWKKLKVRFECWRWGHDWWYSRDYDRTYRNIGMFYINRTCHTCGRREVGMPKLGETAYQDVYGDPDRSKFFWVKESIK